MFFFARQPHKVSCADINLLKGSRDDLAACGFLLNCILAQRPLIEAQS
jgi:hypothetical protein